MILCAGQLPRVCTAPGAISENTFSFPLRFPPRIILRDSQLSLCLGPVGVAGEQGGCVRSCMAHPSRLACFVPWEWWCFLYLQEQLVISFPRKAIVAAFGASGCTKQNKRKPAFFSEDMA